VTEWQEKHESQTYLNESKNDEEDSVDDSNLFHNSMTQGNENERVEDEANAVFSSDDGCSEDDSESIKMNAAITPRKTALYL
jgi:hypothetical protein